MRGRRLSRTTSLDPLAVERLDFDSLDETEFEAFCFELLIELGFVNIDWRKGTGLKSSPADRGRDIEADLERTDVDGSRHVERWFVDPTHYKRGIPSEAVQALLAWANAERPDVALVITSNFLSNPTKDYLRDYEQNNRPPFRIKYWFSLPRNSSSTASGTSDTSCSGAGTRVGKTTRRKRSTAWPSQLPSV